MSLLVHVFLLWCKLVCANSFANCPLFGNLGFWSNVSVVICYGLFAHVFEVKKNCRMKNEKLLGKKVALLWERNDVPIITAHGYWYLSVQPKPLLVLVDVKVVFGECWCVEGLWKIFSFVSPKPEFDEFQSWETCHLIHYLKWFQNSIGIVRDESFHGKLVANGNQYRRYYVLWVGPNFFIQDPTENI